MLFTLAARTCERRKLNWVQIENQSGENCIYSHQSVKLTKKQKPSEVNLLDMNYESLFQNVKTDFQLVNRLTLISIVPCDHRASTSPQSSKVTVKTM